MRSEKGLLTQENIKLKSYLQKKELKIKENNENIILLQNEKNKLYKDYTELVKAVANHSRGYSVYEENIQQNPFDNLEIGNNIITSTVDSPKGRHTRGYSLYEDEDSNTNTKSETSPDFSTPYILPQVKMIQ
jgi:hypothetical protein